MGPPPTHERWMREALALARRGEGLTRPNPPVGALVVRGDQVVGQGFHSRAGGAHAEVKALDQAGSKARGATLYATLEPCSTAGRTPACTDRILASGVARVIVAVTDPNPRHRGRGTRRLRRAGIEVDVGVCRPEGAALIAPFRRWITSGRPYVSLKLAQSLDGRIADADMQSKWITGAPARRAVQDLRRRADAILVGRKTAAVDNPSLLPRPARGRSPYRVVLDRAGRLPTTLRLLSDEHAERTIVAVGRACPRARRDALARHGAEIEVLPIRKGQLSLADALDSLGRRGVLHVLCEGGGELAASLVRDNLVDEFHFFIAPRIIGGGASIAAIGGNGWPLKDAPRLAITEVVTVGDDLLVRATPTGRS